MKRHVVCSAVLILLVLAAGVSRLHADWIEDGLGVCREVLGQLDCDIASDGAGGSIVVWHDYRDGTYNKVFAQRIDACGDPLWTQDGIQICTAPSHQNGVKVVSDGSGGAIIVWGDYRSGSHYDIYAQRIDSDGLRLWASTGVAICTASYYQDTPAIMPDGSGGAIIAWRDIRSNFDYDIYAQRINASGVVQWTVDGVAISAVSGSNQVYAQLAPDGYDGAIITWADTRSGQYDIYAQRIHSSGAVQWTADGVSICSATNHQYYPEIIQDPSGGAIIVWTDYRTGAADIYAQKIDAIASILWSPVDGISVCNAAEDQTNPKLIPVSTGGTIIAWNDRRNATDHDIYAQRIDANGNYLWTYRGIPICTVTDHQYMEAAVADANDCAILIWKDLRGGSSYDLYSQKLNPYGELLWTATGVAISAAANDQVDVAAVTDGADGVIVAWEDDRSGVYEDIFAQRIDCDGYWGCPEPAIMSVRDVPQDQGGFINLAWNASQYDPPGQITEYTIWRALDISLAAMMMAGDACVISSASDIPTIVDGPVIRMEMLNGEPYYWEMIDSHSAYLIDTYSKIVQSPFDSTATSNEYQYFQIIAHTAVPAIFWVSDPDSGYSVDNIAPCPPAMLAGAQEHLPEGLRLTWDPNAEIDHDDYNIYRGMDESFVPGPGNLLASPCDTFYFDGGWTWDSGYCYKVAAVDIHGNESGCALLCSDNITGDETPATPLATYLAQNHPNPFNPSTTIAFGLSTPGHVSIRIYDAAGRLVRVLVEKRREAGTYNEIWNGLDDRGESVASGIYFYRLVADEFVQTKKMVLLK